jgi:hypothetical protein
VECVRNIDGYWRAPPVVPRRHSCFGCAHRRTNSDENQVGWVPDPPSAAPARRFRKCRRLTCDFRASACASQDIDMTVDAARLEARATSESGHLEITDNVHCECVTLAGETSSV